MATRTTARAPRPRRRPSRAAVRSAAERAVERVLTSDDAFALLLQRLEEAGWHIERDASLTPPPRPR